MFSVTAYLPMRLALATPAGWSRADYPLPDPDQPYPALPWLLLCRHWGRSAKPAAWPAGGGRRLGQALAGLARLCTAFYAAILVLVYAHHNWVADFNSPPPGVESRLRPCLCGLQRRDDVQEPAIFLASSSGPGPGLIDAMRPSAYGIFLVHYIFIIWLQYAVYDYSLPAGVKAAIVFAGTLSLSWGLILLLRKIPLVARMI